MRRKITELTASGIKLSKKLITSFLIYGFHQYHSDTNMNIKTKELSQGFPYAMSAVSLVLAVINSVPASKPTHAAVNANFPKFEQV